MVPITRRASSPNKICGIFLLIINVSWTRLLEKLENSSEANRRPLEATRTNTSTATTILVLLLLSLESLPLLST